jgi:hypothetical protein
MSTEGETLQVCPTLQVLDMSTLGDAADVNPVIKELDYRIVTKGGHIEHL